jgi:hypothetical protein
MALANSSTFPFGDFGVSPPAQQSGPVQGTFPKYASFLTNMVSQGIYESATFSLWIDPQFGPENTPTFTPTGSVMFGGIDTSLFTGGFTTLPTVAINSTHIPPAPERWNLALQKMHLGEEDKEESLVSNPEGESCVISTGANVLYLTQPTYNALIAAMPQAVFNATTKLYELPCPQRRNSSNSLSLTFVDPRYILNETQHVSGNIKDHSFTLTMPASETIWPVNQLVPGSSSNACAIAAFAIDEVTPCSLGISLVKSGYWVYDLGNAEISFANIAKKGEREGHVIELPGSGVKGLKW